MYKDFIKQSGIEMIPILVLLLFLIIFIVVFIVVLRYRKSFMDEMSNMPLDNEKTKSNNYEK